MEFAWALSKPLHGVYWRQVNEKTEKRLFTPAKRAYSQAEKRFQATSIASSPCSVESIIQRSGLIWRLYTSFANNYTAVTKQRHQVMASTSTIQYIIVASESWAYGVNRRWWRRSQAQLLSTFERLSSSSLNAETFLPYPKRVSDWDRRTLKLPVVVLALPCRASSDEAPTTMKSNVYWRWGVIARCFWMRKKNLNPMIGNDCLLYSVIQEGNLEN